jgi:hypothetical protein
MIKNSLHIYGIDTVILNNFDSSLVESTDVEPTDQEI